MKVGDLKTAHLVGDETPRIYDLENDGRAEVLEWLVGHIQTAYGVDYKTLDVRAQAAALFVVCDAMERAEPNDMVEGRLAAWISVQRKKNHA